MLAKNWLSLRLSLLLSRRVSGTKKGSTKIKVPAQKKSKKYILVGMNGQDPLTTAAFIAFSVSNSSLLSIALGDRYNVEIR